jgi:hypothetical protein
VWGGQDIKIFGKGTLNGNGQEWYNAFAGMEILVSIAFQESSEWHVLMDNLGPG